MWLCLLLKLGLPEQAVGWFPLRFGLVVEDKPTEFSSTVFLLKIRHGNNNIALASLKF